MLISVDSQEAGKRTGRRGLAVVWLLKNGESRQVGRGGQKRTRGLVPPLCIPQIMAASYSH